MPHAPFRKVLNTQLYVLITGCRWCDIPRGEQWASKSSAHRWLKRWYEDGRLEKLKRQILAVAEEKGTLDWKYGVALGSFSPWKGGGKSVAYGYKGKGILIHSITDANGMPLVAMTTPANGDRRQQVLPMLAQIRLATGKRGNPKRRPKTLAADKGYDAK